MRNSKNNNNCGFTIVEFLFALTIIGILAALSAPGVDARQNIRLKRACVSNMKTIEGAVELYQMENGKIDVITPKELQVKGYLKTEPRCPASLSSYTVVMTPGSDKTANIIDIECMTSEALLSHGKLSLQETEDKSKGL